MEQYRKGQENAVLWKEADLQKDVINRIQIVFYFVSSIFHV